MNIFDIVLLIVLAIFTGIGVWRGFVRELISFITWIAACVSAWMFSDRLAGVFESLMEEDAVRQMLAFIVIFIAVFIVGTVIGLLLHKMVNRSAGLRTANRVTGGFVGLFRGVVIIVVVFLLAGLTSFPKSPWWRDALLSPPFERAATYACKYLPQDIARYVRYG